MLLVNAQGQAQLAAYQTCFPYKCNHFPKHFQLTVHAGRPVVTVNGTALVAWTFDYNNVLAWADEAGYSAWLQCLVLPGGPVFVGKITNGDAYEGAPLFVHFRDMFVWGIISA